MKEVWALLLPGWADWEAAFVLSGFRRHFAGRTWVATPDGGPVESIGGICAQAHSRFRDVAPEAGSVLLLIGSDGWSSFSDEATFEMLNASARRDCVVGAICGGTIAVARAGLLDGRSHTSNAREFLQRNAPGYAGAEFYKETRQAVGDGNLVTASGLSPLSFAATVFRTACPDDADKAEKYHRAYSEEGAPLAPRRKAQASERRRRGNGNRSLK